MRRAPARRWDWFCHMTSNRECLKPKVWNSINEDDVTCRPMFGFRGNGHNLSKEKPLYLNILNESRRKKDEYGSSTTKNSLPSECAALFRFTSNGDYGLCVAKLSH